MNPHRAHTILFVFFPPFSLRSALSTHAALLSPHADLIHTTHRLPPPARLRSPTHRARSLLRRRRRVEPSPLLLRLRCAGPGPLLRRRRRVGPGPLLRRRRRAGPALRSGCRRRPAVAGSGCGGRRG
ncbi:hypothetical protein PVAP13_9NG092573 [Panicum virgatum]|uniref:Uncharacterized protein n=1 Tax=Panicum virgatum TaxID=38727 RepID=A0A8T0MHB5_PANVG|nr:hypothetical protein PVAP13_9NG092573 [Panicum virgatum]